MSMLIPPEKMVLHESDGWIIELIKISGERCYAVAWHQQTTCLVYRTNVYANAQNAVREAKEWLNYKGV